MNTTHKSIKIRSSDTHNKLYHFTSPNNANNILKENELRSGVQSSIFFTRDKKHKYSYSDFINKPNINLIFNKDNLKNNYKIKPSINLSDRDESIEKIKGKLKNVNKYLDSIEIDKNLHNKIKNNPDYSHLINHPKLKVI